MAIWMGCTHPAAADPTEGDRPTTERGVIYRLSPESTLFTIIRVSNPRVRYSPDQLPDGFTVDSLRVILSGEVLPVADDIRLPGSPLTLTMIQRE
jgi:hypothetical protein